MKPQRQNRGSSGHGCWYQIDKIFVNFIEGINIQLGLLV